jgi:hypothetical protein
MVNDDPARGILPAILVMGLFTCGCLQTPTGDGSLKATTAFGFHPKSAVSDDSVVLAVAKPARSTGAPQATTVAAQSAEEGPDLNGVQTASAKEEVPAGEQAPAPRAAQSADATGLPAAPSGQPGKNPPAAPGQANKTPPVAPGNAPAPGQRNGIGSYNPDPAFASRKPVAAPPGPYPPGTAGLVPPGGIPLDPHQRQVPTASGALLNLAPGESPAERALELSARLSAAEADRVALDHRAHELTVALESRDRALQQHGHDIHEAAEEVARAREQVTAWHKELDTARVRLRSREMEDVQTLKAIIAVLERLTEPSTNGPDARHEGSPARMPEE